MLTDRARRLAGQLTPLGWILIAALALVCAWYVYMAATQFQVDLAVYRDGVRAAWSRGDLYDLLFPPVGLPFTYPPFAALVFTPLAALPETATQVIWCLISLACAIAYGAVCVRDFAADRYWSVTLTLAVLVALLISDPLRVGLLFGQINAVLAILVILDLGGRTGRIPQGVLIGIAAAIKLVPLFLIAYFLVTRRFKSAVVTAVAFVVATGIAFLWFPQASAQYWGGLVLDSTRVGGIAYISNQSVQGVLVRVTGGPTQAKLVWLVCAAVLAAAMLWVCWRVFPVFPAVSTALVLATMLMVSPVSWTHHWILILPLLLVALFPATRLASRTLKALAAALAAVLLLGVIWWVPNTGDQEYRHSVWQFLLGNSYVILTVALMIGLAVVAVRALPAAAEPAATEAPA